MPSSAAAATAATSAAKLTEETVIAALSSYANDPRLAYDFYTYVSSPPISFPQTPKTLTLTLDILAKHLHFPLALSLQPSPPSPSSLRSLFSRLSAARLPSAAVDLFRSSSPGDLQTFHLLIDSLCDRRLVSVADQLCLRSDSPPFPADTKIHNLILHGWMKLGCWPRCRALWHEMDRKGIPKDLHSYTIYLNVLSKSGKPWKALRLYREMTSKRLDLDVVVYNSVIQAAGFAEGADRAVRVFREMIDCGCWPNVVSFNTVIKMMCREGRLKEGYGFLFRMKKEGIEPNVISYHSFFQYSVRPKEILCLFERMLESGVRPRMDTYVMLMRKFGRWGFLRPVFMIWNKMEENGESPDVFAYNAMINALLQKGMVELARKYDQEMLAKGISPKPRKELRTDCLGVEEHDDDENAFSGVL